MQATAPLAIRGAVEDDLPAITAILNDAIATRASTALAEPVDVDDRRAWLREHGPRHPLWVAADERGIAGWISVLPWSDRAGYDGTAEVGVYVAPDRHRRGIGGKLLRHAIAQAPRLGLEVYVARVFTHNPASTRLFERSTFSAGA
jgi:L-amino acid N-acyltransferase YncA